MAPKLLRTLSIIIPAYNEGSTITELLDQVLAVELRDGVRRELVIVDDGSKDDTAERARAFRAAHPAERIQVFVQPINRGKGAAIYKGIQLAEGDHLIVQDADLELAPGRSTTSWHPCLPGKPTCLRQPVRRWAPLPGVSAAELPREPLSYLAQQPVHGVGYRRHGGMLQADPGPRRKEAGLEGATFRVRARGHLPIGPGKGAALEASTGALLGPYPRRGQEDRMEGRRARHLVHHALPLIKAAYRPQRLHGPG
jgi:hypothetical protein